MKKAIVILGIFKILLLILSGCVDAERFESAQNPEYNQEACESAGSIVIVHHFNMPYELIDWYWSGQELPLNVTIRDNVDYAYLCDGLEVRPVRAGDKFMGLETEEVNATFAEFDDGRIWYISKLIKFRGVVEMNATITRFHFQPSGDSFLEAVVSHESIGLIPVNRFLINTSGMHDEILNDILGGNFEDEHPLWSERFKELEYMILISDLRMILFPYESSIVEWNTAELINFTRIE